MAQHNAGDSWMQGRMDSRLEMTFATSRISGLLFLASGEDQYLIVEIVNGTLRVKLHRASSESVVNSQGHLTLNNLEDHKLQLAVMESKMILIVDNLTSSTDLPSPAEELNWKHGVYIGGVGNTDLSSIPTKLPTFHGCIREANLNNINLLSHTHPLLQLHGQWDNCQPMPTPTFTGTFGFLGPRSYMIFPTWDVNIQGSIHFTIVTSRAGRAPLLYQSGPRTSYFHVEIAGGYLQVTIHTGEIVAQMQNTVYISDGHLHRVQIIVDSSEVKLEVDNAVTKLPVSDLGPDFEFYGNLYLGGVDETVLAKMRDGLLDDSYVDDMEYRSFIGCIKDLTVNSVKRGLRDAMLVKDVTAGCQDYEYYDYNEYDDTITPITSTAIIPVTTTTSHGTIGITRPLVKCKPDPKFPNLTSLVSPQSLFVTRGGSSVLQWQHLHPTPDLGKLGIRPSQVLLNLASGPQHGSLELDIPGAETRRKFTLLDVNNRRVRYVHDGSQSHEDGFSIDVSVPSGVNLPVCLTQVQRHTLPIYVLSAVSMPTFHFPKGDKLAMLAHETMTLTPDVIQILDSDSLCEQLTISVAVNVTWGQVELKYKPDEAIHEFSCVDLKNSQILFIHKSGSQAQLTVQVNDRTSRGSSANFTIFALEPEVNKIMDAGLLVSPGASVFITPSNLLTFTNTGMLGHEIMYQLIENPKLGEVQRLVDGRQWMLSQGFWQSDLERNRVRYISRDASFHGGHSQEDLLIQIQLWSQDVTNKTLKVRITKPSVQIRRLSPLRVGRRREVRLTDMELQVDSTDLHSVPVAYTIIQSPRKGNLQLIGQRLPEGSHFTQQDLENGHVSYAATVRNTKEMEDQFQFQVILGDQISPVYSYKIQIGVDPDAPQLTNKLLHVLEGGEVAIRPDHLFLKSSNSANFIYEVIDGPQHGKLIRIGSQREIGIVEFSNDDILRGNLVYQHDGSETTEDDIPFVASRQQEGSASDTSGEEENDDEEEEVVRGVFRVSIQLVNDNPPVQVVQKTFHVVRDGQRLLTTNDIAFSDPDLGTTDAQIVLVRYGVPFGRIVFIDDPSLLVFRFTQEDLRMHRILYIHDGPDQGSIQLQVSDGLYHLTTILDVQASEPFIRISNITALNVPSGGQGVLTSANLKFETNLDLRNDDEIRYHIVSQPRWGRILKGGRPTDSFSQFDLAGGLLVYEHGGESIKRDSFQISVEVNQVISFSEIEVRVGTESPSVTLKVIHNEKVYVFQGEAAEIKHLMVSAVDTFPHKITYTLTDPPAFGYLVAVSEEPSSDGSASLDSVHTFTQEDINRGRILYLHSASETLPDRMTLDVAVDGEIHQDIVVSVEVLPFYIPLEATELHVNEGGTATITTGILQVPNEYFLGLQLGFEVLSAPRRGRIINTDKREVRSFDWNELDQGRVLYEHDGSETLSDSFTIIANASDINHQSQPVTVNVTVQAVNDEAPRVVTNRGLEVLEEDTADISAQVLQTDDADSSPEDVIYSIQSPTNGQVTLRPSRGRILSFSQKQVNDGLVKFKHKGAHDGGFFFTVSDGKHQTEQHFFKIQVLPFSINVKTTKSLMACPNSLQLITNQHLTALTNERKAPPPALVVYHIEEPPRIGQIVRMANGEKEVSNFTQSDVDAGLIYYKHTADESPFWTALDYFSFHVTSQFTASQRYLLNVTVTFQEPCPQRQTRLWKNTGITVPEGGSSPIDRATLDASNLLANPTISRFSHDVVFLLTRLPTQGHLSIEGSPLDQHVPHFLQSHLDQGSLLYFHTGSTTQEDSLQFKAWLWPKLKPFHEAPHERNSLVITENLNVTVISRPNLPPLMVTPPSAFKLAPGSYAALTTDLLSVQNTYISPEKISYTILEAPSGISVAKQGHIPVTISHFTQEDLSKLSLIILANFTAISGPIKFNVTAGHQFLGIALLPIQVLPVFHATLDVPQASGISRLTTEHFPPTTEETAQRVTYKLTKQPIYGHLVVGKDPVTEFMWKQIKEGEVSYAFTSFSLPNDEFWFLTINPGGEDVAGVVTLTVSAMVKIGERKQWPRGCRVKLGTDTIDASELATNTQSDPEFRVLRHPRGGKLVRISQMDGESTVIDSFTQSQLENGLIGMELWDAEPSATDVESDRIHMELSANRVPPAKVTVRFTTVPYNISYPDTVPLVRVTGNFKTTTTTQATATASLEPTSQIVTTSLEPRTYMGQTTHPETTTSLQSTSNSDIAKSIGSTNFVHTTSLDSHKHLKPTGLASTAQEEHTTILETTTRLDPTIHPESTTYLEPNTKMISTSSGFYSTVQATTVMGSVSTGSRYTQSLTNFATVVLDLSETEIVAVNTTQDLALNSSWTVEIVTTPAPLGNDTFMGFMSANVYNIIIPICLVLLLLIIGLLLLIYLVRRKKMGMHHVQKAASSSKPENGANNRQTFRPAEPDRGIPLCEVGAEHRSNGAGQAPAGSQYWV
uniref:Chondroitin sulfate proteoglycan 4 n=1 Tax=Leptobrachium leishanense TaxID=445787 RepID=A0A8C5WES9_9ANUR